MQIIDRASCSGTTRVVHWVGRVSDEIFDFLGPVTRALADSGVTQTVIAFDDEHVRRLLPGFNEGVDLVLVPSGGNPIQNWLLSLNTVRNVVRHGPVSAIHLHGFFPGLAGAWVVPSSKSPLPIYYSPHTSHALGSLQNVETALRAFARTPWMAPERRIISNLMGEAQRLAERTRRPVGLIESPVADLFFDVVPVRADKPLVVSGTRTPEARGAMLMAQIAVLFNDKSLHMRFVWLGKERPKSIRRLRAAGVQVFEANSDEERASRLGAAWIYLAVGGSHGFPVSLTEAMAVGLPCVAVDTSDHRDLVRHGETGFLYSNEDELLTYIARLVDSKSMRLWMGNAARKSARERFSADQFRKSLLSAYVLE